MSKTIEIAQELKQELDALPLFQEYKRVKNLVDNSDELNSLKQEIVKAKATNKDSLHKELLERYNSHPLIVNLKALEDEVAEYLNQISKIVNKK